MFRYGDAKRKKAFNVVVVGRNQCLMRELDNFSSCIMNAYLVRALELEINVARILASLIGRAIKYGLFYSY